MSFLNMRKITFSVCLMVLLQLSIISAGSIRARITTEIGKGKSVSKTVNSQRSARTPTTTPKQDFQPESRADEVDVAVIMATTTMGSIMPTNEESLMSMKHDTVDDIEPSTTPNLTEDTTDMAMPIWDSTKIETPKMHDDSETLSDEMRKPGSEHSLVDRKKEAERLRKVVSAFHFNRVFGTTAAPTPVFRAALPAVTPTASTRQRALGFPLLITNTLDNFHHQLDWSRFGAFSAELE
uniref:Uncharacterized protein n=1 Tax=Daphnia galeata TaxID=27404 RepID=A0A8J2RRC3_9CRUS|nr:unnamed protein product [Daphnia galeata]